MLLAAQAAVLAGFTMTALAEVTVPPSCGQLPDNSPLRQYTMDSPQCTSIMLKGAFYLLVLVSMAAQIHCVCNTTFITVWGAGLALRGPDGSMVEACDGMVAERRQVFISFGIGLIAFLFSAIAVSWILMPPLFAFVGTCVLLGSMVLIKHCASSSDRALTVSPHADLRPLPIDCERVYERFRLTKVVDFEDMLDFASTDRTGAASFAGSDI